MRVKQDVPWPTKTLAEEEARDWAVTTTLLSKQGGQQPMQGQSKLKSHWEMRSRN